MKISPPELESKPNFTVCGSLLITNPYFFITWFYMADSSKLAAFIKTLRRGLPISEDPFDPNYFDLKEGCIAIEEEIDLAAVCIANTYFKNHNQERRKYE